VEVPVREASVGDRVCARLVLRSEGRGLSRLRIEDPAACWSVTHPGLGGRPSAPAEGHPDSSPRPRTLPVRDVRSGSPVTVAVPVDGSCRGVAVMRGPRAWCEDPFGLFASEVGEGPGARLIVLPVPRSPSAGAHRALGGPGTRPAMARVPAGAPRLAGDELDRLRPYVPGDRLTRLHWQALARTGDLVVREFTTGETGRLTILVDVRPGVDPAALEAAVSTAAGMGIAALGEHTAVELCTSAGERVVVPPGPSGRLDFLRALAMVGPTRPRRDEAMRWDAHSTGGALWATDNLADAGQVLVTARPGGDDSLPDALAPRTTVVVVR